MAKRIVEVEWTQTAAESLREIGSRTVQQKIVDKIAAVAASGEPELLGKPLVDELQGLHRISFGRYRMVYRVIRDSRKPETFRVVVRVILAGIRRQGDKRDIYERLRRLVQCGTL